MFIKENLSFLLADNHSVVRKGFSLIIEELVDKPIIYHSSSIAETIQIIKKNKIDILILDINFPKGNNTDIVSEIREINLEIKILMFSAIEEDIYALRYINAGANGFLNKTSSEMEMKEAVSTFIQTGKYFTPHIKEKIVDKFMYKKNLNPIDQLSDREMEIALLLIKGYGNLEISLMKMIQPTTVSTYKKRIFEKLSIDNLVSLIHIMNPFNNEIN